MLNNKFIDASKIKNKVWLSIYLNFVDNNIHGCNKNCTFCQFKSNPIYMCPSIEDVKEFLSLYGKKARDNLLLLTGGGDPLYKFEKNKDELLRIINCLKDLGCEISIVTREWETVLKYWNTDLIAVDTWIFSCEYKDEKLRALVPVLIKAGKYVRITKIFNHTDKLEDLNWADIKEFIKFYKDLPVYFRINFNFNWNKIFIRVQDQLYKLKDEISIYGTNFYLLPDIKQHIGLYQNEVWNTAEFDNLVRQSAMED